MNRDYHTIQVAHDVFVVDVRYTDLKRIGQGAYGNVVSAIDTHTNTQKVAIKKIKHTFHEKIIAKRILREIKLLRHFRQHENVITLLDIMTIPSDTPEQMDDVYIVSNCMESDLDRILHSSQPLSDGHYRYFLYQILRGLKYVHSANVVHRDLKPSNILVNANCDLVLCDFGLSRGLSTTKQQQQHHGNDEHDETDNATTTTNENLTEYVVTRWYRAPELLCDSKNYGMGVDLWSVGCIFAEMLTRQPFFQGRSPHHQLEIIIKVLGCPSNVDELEFARTHPLVRNVIEQAQEVDHHPGLRPLLPEDVKEEALDLLEKLLVVKPEERITAEEALGHPYLRELHETMEEPVCDNVFDTTFEETTKDVETITKEDLKRMMYSEALELYRERMETEETQEDKGEEEEDA